MRKCWLKLMLVLGLLLLWQAFIPDSASAEEALQNGGFSNGLNHWYVNDALADWDPLVNGAVSLHPPQWSFTGTVISQNLNIDEISSKTVSVSLKLNKSYDISGNSVAVYLEYVDNNDQRQHVKVLNPNNASVGEWTYHGETFTFPASARKLVKLSLAKESYGEFLVDEVSLQSGGATIGAKPIIHSIDQSQGSYGSTITINGEHFGPAYVTNKSYVSISGSTTGISVESWTDTRITISVLEPAQSGRVMVTSDFVESNNDIFFNVTSPYFKVSVLNPQVRLIKGETARFVVRVDFMNDFTTENGIGFFVPEHPNAVFSPVTLKSSGGVMLSIDTASLAPGTYNWNVQSLEDNSYAQFVPITIEVLTVDDIAFFTYDADYERVDLPSPLNVITQGQVSVYYTATDAGGDDLWSAPVTLTSSDPSKLFVYSHQWGTEIYALDNGTADLVASTPDGFTRTLTVNINIPDSPRILSIGLSPQQVTNKGDQTIYFSATGTGSIGAGYQNLILVNHEGDWSGDNNQSYQATFRVNEGEKPGVYLFNAFTYTGNPLYGGQVTAKAVVPLTIVNDPDMGEISGSVSMLAQGTYPPDASGTVELYDATGNLVEEFTVWSHTSHFSIPYVSPGTYRVRFVPDGENLAPQWYPNAESFDSASDVYLAAGHVLEGINFFLREIPVPVPSIQNVTVSVYNHVAGTAQTVDVGVTTVDVANGATVTAELVSTSGVPVSPAVSDEATIDNNSATLTLSIPSDIPAGEYRIKVTVGTSPEIFDDSTGYVISYPEPVAGDIDEDGQVATADLELLADHYGEPSVDAKLDLEPDGMIDLYDLVRLARRMAR